MPTLRKIVSFFCVDCKRSTCLYPMQRLIINKAATATIEVNSIRLYIKKVDVFKLGILGTPYYKTPMGWASWNNGK